MAVFVGNNGLSHSVFALFIGFRVHRRYYTTVELELSNSQTLELSTLELLYSLASRSSIARVSDSRSLCSLQTGKFSNCRA
jgi:hypothetical protein